MNVLKLLFNPIFLLAAGLHAGLLLIPVAGGSSEGLVPAPDPEGESITVTRIPPKVAKPVKPGTGQTAQANRPATNPATTTPVAATVGKPTTGTNTQQRAQGNSRTQGGQQHSGVSRDSSVSGSRSNSSSRIRSNRRSNRDNSSNQTARNTPAPGLPDLPSNRDTSNNVPVTVPSETPSTQSPPTLIALKNGATSQGVPQLLRDFLARLQYSLQETRDSITTEAQQAWLAELEANQPGIDISNPQELEKALEINYPLVIESNGPRQINSCLNPLPKKGLIGAVVDENGKLAAEPTLLRSSGYPILNDIALNEIKDYSEFPDENTQKIYTIPVEVKYNEEACVSLTKLGVVPPVTTNERRTPPTPPEGSRNFLEEDDSPSPFGR
ncbi:MAG: hypothetical protein F6K11_22880 [Leptolyngbya sp. SIO3F4]|nr:hypothetical protein [Leptolyngbya sp. SIO3F4]